MPSVPYVKSKIIAKELEFFGKYLLLTGVQRHSSVNGEMIAYISSCYTELCIFTKEPKIFDN